MSLPYYLEFLNWHMSAVGRKNDAILATKMWNVDHAVIIHIAICLPIRWLAGKCHELKGYDFGPRHGKYLRQKKQSVQYTISVAIGIWYINEV